MVLVGIYFRLEPYYYTLKDLGLLEKLPWLVTIIIRTTFSYTCVLETTCTFVLYSPVIQHFYIYLKCLEILKGLELSRKSIKTYNQVLILHQWGDWMVKYAFTVYLGVGLYLCIIFNILTFVGWKVFPLPLYMFCVHITFLFISCC